MVLNLANILKLTMKFCLRICPKMAAAAAATQVVSEEDYYLTCVKCQDEGSSGLCVDGIWLFDVKDNSEPSPTAGIYCCTKCVDWFKKKCVGYFKDKVVRDWFRYTKRDVCKWSRAEWTSTEENTNGFVEYAKKAPEKKKRGPPKKKEVRKRKRPTIDLAQREETQREDSYVFDPESTFQSIDQQIKTMYAFIEICNRNDPESENYVSVSVSNILTMQINVLGCLMDTLQDNMK